MFILLQDSVPFSIDRHWVYFEAGTQLLSVCRNSFVVCRNSFVKCVPEFVIHITFFDTQFPLSRVHLTCKGRDGCTDHS
jgi:hypothetical protein